MGSPQPAPQPDGGPARTGAEPPGPRRLRRRILLLALVPLLAAVLLIALAVRQQTADLSRREHALVESAYMAAKEVELRNHVDIAMSALQPLYDTGRDDPQIKAEAIRLLNSIRYGSSAGDGYFFAYDFEGRCLVLPHQPELVGSNLWDVRDRDGRYVVQALVARAREGQGYFRYVWNKPSLRQVAPKLGYVVGLPRWQWMVGTGLYLDDIQATLDALDRQGREHIWTTLLWIGGISLLALSLVAGSALALNLSEYRAADAQLQSMARQVVQSQEYERAHLSRELHDSTGQTLVSIKLLLDSALAELTRQGCGAVPAALSKARTRLDDALSEVRHLSHRLRPALLDTLGLPSALRQIGEEFAEHADLAFFMRLRGPQTELPDAVKTVLFRITQEALTNIDKHAYASRVDVRLLFHRRGVRLTVQDDGLGFNVAAVQDDPQRGIGLRNMRERLGAVGATLRVQSRPGATRLVADVPRAAVTRLARLERAARLHAF
jgi:two-component system NarL family sensor kinase